MPPSDFYRISADQALETLASSPRSGLSHREARARLETYGRNELISKPPIPAWRKFLAQFTDVLVLLLIAAAAVSAMLWFYERDAPLPYEALAIAAIVLLNAILGFVQQARAEKALAALQEMQQPEPMLFGRGSGRASRRANLCPATSS